MSARGSNLGGRSCARLAIIPGLPEPDRNPPMSLPDPLVIRWGATDAPAATGPAGELHWPDLAPDRRGADARLLVERLAGIAGERPVLLLRADVELPEAASRRLLASMAAAPGAILAPLDNLDPTHSPLPADGRIEAPLDVARLDALCAWLGERALLACRELPLAASLWPAGAAGRLLDADWRGGELPDGVAWRCDHVFAAVPGRALEGPAHWPLRDVPPPADTLEAIRGRWCVPRPGDFDVLLPVDAIAPPPGPLPGAAGIPTILHVSHSWGGGSERFLRDLAAADGDRCHLLLSAHGATPRRAFGEWLELRPAADPTLLLGRWPLDPVIADSLVEHPLYAQLLRDIVERWHVDAVVVSSVIGHGLAALRTGLPTVVVCHDYYPLWPELHCDFGDRSRRFDRAELERDLAARPLTLFASHGADYWWGLREAYAATVLERGIALAAPTQQVRENMIAIAPALARANWRIVPHGIVPWPQAKLPASTRRNRERLRVLVPGRLAGGKGLRLAMEVMARTSDAVEFVFLGAGDAATALFGHARAHVIYDYRRDELPAWLARLAPDVALLPATVAETFGYLLSELQALGLPVLATAIGSYRERISDGRDGFLAPPEPDAIAGRLATWVADRAALQQVRTYLTSHPARSTADMAADYRELLPVPTPPSREGQVRRPRPDDLRIAWLTRLGFETRYHRDRLHGLLKDSERELERRGQWGFGLQKQLDERTAWAMSLRADLDDRQAELDRILASRSWRLLGVLRRGARIARAQRARVAFHFKRAIALARRVRLSLATRGVAGTLRHWRHRRAQSQGPAPFALKPVVAPTSTVPPASLPTSDTPMVSIVIPVYGKLAYTCACLASLAEHAGDVPFEVIVVDDASPDGSADALEGVQGLRLLRNTANLGFVGSCNAGAAAARAPWLVFLNNDTTVTAGWLEALLRTFEDLDGTGLAGSRLVYPDGRLQEAGGLVFSDGSGWNYGRFADPSDPRYGYARETHYCSGAAIMIERALFDRLGGFDARYAPAYYEDTDLAFKVREAGLKVIVQPASTVIHHEGVTSGTDTGSGIKRHQVINQATFRERWRTALARLPAPGTDVEAAVRAAPNGRVLVIDATTPAPDQDSGSVRLVNLLRLIRESGRHVTFFADNRSWVAGDTERLQRLGIEVLFHPWLADPVDWLRRNGPSLDTVIVCRHYIAVSYLDLVRQYAPQARFVFDTVDLHYLREQRAAALDGNEEIARQAARTREQELRLIHAADVTVVVSPTEQALLATDAPGARVEVLSNVHPVVGCRRGFAERRDLMFVGGFQHPPNVDAVTWFAREVFPQVRESLPDVRFHVIGSRTPPAVQALAGNGVVIHGHVADLDPFLDGCRIALAPLRYGAGVKGKVNMSMSYGQPVVATSMAVEGMHLIAGEEVLVADDPAGFAAAVVRLYGDAALWQRLSAAGLGNVRRHFSFDAARAALARILAR